MRQERSRIPNTPIQGQISSDMKYRSLKMRRREAHSTHQINFGIDGLGCAFHASPLTFWFTADMLMHSLTPKTREMNYAGRKSRLNFWWCIFQLSPKRGLRRYQAKVSQTPMQDTRLQDNSKPQLPTFADTRVKAIQCDRSGRSHSCA